MQSPTLRTLRVLRTLLPALLAFALTACSRSDSDTPARAGHSIQTIADAYVAATRDGLFATHLAPLVHPELVGSVSQNRLFTDNPAAARPDTEPPAHTLRDLAQGEIGKLRQFFELPIEPNKVIEFTQTRADGPTKTTSRIPLYLRGEAGAFTIVFGVPRNPAEIEAARDRESLRFYEDDGLWKQHWELQLAPDPAARYTLALIDAPSGDTLETLSGPEPVKLPDNRRVVNVHLLAKGMAAVHETTAAGAVSVPYAFQIGASATSATVTLPLTAVTSYLPNREPAFVGDLITLATFEGTTDNAPRTLTLVLLRSR
ncbi:MAG: hypothetical protein ABII82_16810 [Verrucomicrobiota bacterium]